MNRKREERVAKVCAVWRSELLETLADDRLVERTLEGEREAFEGLLSRYARSIYNFISNYVGDYDVAQDAFQEAFVRAYKNLCKYRIGTNFSAWLHKVALNACKDCLKRVKRAGRLEAREGEDFDPLELVAGREPSPHLQLERGELRDAVRAALGQLSDVHRQVILFYQFQGFSYEEIAHMMRCPLGTVKSRIHYAMRRLGELISDRAKEYVP